MIPWSLLTPSPPVVIVCGILALIAGVVFLRRHNYMIIPVLYSILWVTLGYVFYWIGGIDIEGLGFFVRSGLMIFFLSIVVGGAILIHESRK